MAERTLVVDHMRLMYEGLFDVEELYAMIQEWFREKGYDKREDKNYETVTPTGKYVELVLEPWKKITDYAKFVVKIRMVMEDVKKVDIEREGLKVTVNQGKVSMIFDAWFETDYENRWESKPEFFFIRTMFDRFIFVPYTERFKARLLEDVNQLYGNIKGFLNLYRYESEAVSGPPTPTQFPKF
ncbi:hypothetical protein J4460_01385 [Candidatus Woesearchaeota archaeon]|nr:MAG: hypothetical protein QS99_C0001G0092 [archaeon GW2011_AR4]MBS3129303.1 hypothetical protein [Candidatus Woesearchaeota archaeon]HIH38606.1 hypothetical protein [Candidatus Woesearchaeota archaeon]HIH48599.1 hypothetical protein [Candidatus Woesearchaeota archaeon]HIJ02810.1 hypothetical protein [Candidatus Woesearchaeota archaeon]